MSAGGAAGGGGAYWGGGAAYCCCSAACCSSWLAQRPACRRDTRFETAVAVPAMTAVRATPRRSPGISLPLLRRKVSARDARAGRLRFFDRRDELLDRDPAAGYHFRPTPTKSCGQR